MSNISNREKIIFSLVSLELIKEQLRQVASQGLLEPTHQSQPNHIPAMIPENPMYMNSEFQTQDYHMQPQSQHMPQQQQQVRQQQPLMTSSTKKTKGKKNESNTISLHDL